MRQIDVNTKKKQKAMLEINSSICVKSVDVHAYSCVYSP